MPRRIAAIALLGCLVAAVLAVTASGAESGATPMCHGERATIVGTDGDDVIQGTEQADVIWAGPGNDKVYGGLGNDVVCGGSGDDLIHGGRGNDWLEGGAGTDRVFGDLGDDHLGGGSGDRDEVSGGLGIDTVNGGPGDEDLVRGDYGYDRMDGGPGKGDIASFSTAVAGLKGSGVWVSLPRHKALGDGHDRLFRFEGIEGSAFHDTLISDKHSNVIDGGPGNDTIIGGGGRDTLVGGQGDDRCKGGPTRISCGREKAPVGSAYIRLDPDPEGGGGLQIVGGAGPDDLVVALTEEETTAGESGTTGTFTVSAAAPLAAGEGCARAAHEPKQVTCPTLGPTRWLMADLGPGNDGLTVQGSLEAVDFVRVNGGDGNDTIHGGPEEDLLQSGPGADHVYGGDGSDGLIGGLPGPTYLYGEGGGDLLAAGGGCAGGTLDGGPGEDDASFAETQAHPGTLYVSLEAGWAWIDAIRHCDKVRLPRSDEDIEGSFDNDVLIGDSRDNVLLGQPGVDSFFGRGGNDVIVAADGVKDWYIQCGRTGHPEGTAIVDRIDPEPKDCAKVVTGSTVQGLGKAAQGN
ncbi:MAG TPA: calcium-binding protein [Solirubrobacterales bacterium]|nr:calcium-binding protein [Solirubrobacterales bacterium]